MKNHSRCNSMNPEMRKHIQRPSLALSLNVGTSLWWSRQVFVLVFFVAALLNPNAILVVSSSSSDDAEGDSTAAVAAPSQEGGGDSSAVESTEVQQQCTCPEVKNNSTLDWSEIIRDKVETIEALNSAAKEKVQTTLSNMERLEHALSNAAMYGKEVATLEVKLNELMEEITSLKKEKEDVENQNTNLSQKIQALATGEDVRQKESMQLKDDLIAVKAQLEKCQAKNGDSIKQREECFKALEEEKINSGKLLSKESERVKSLNEKLGECEVTLNKTEKDLKVTSDESERKLKLLQSKHVESERKLNNLHEEIRFKEEQSGKHYCNATAMRNDLDAAISEWSFYVKTKATPVVERGLQASQQLSTRALNEADELYKAHVKEHVEGSVLPSYRLHVEPHVTKALTMTGEISDLVVSFLADVLQNSCHFVLQQMKQHDHFQQKVPEWIVKSITTAETHSRDSVVLLLKAVGYFLLALFFKKFVFMFLVGPIFVFLGTLIYLAVEVPLHLIHWTVGFFKRSGKHLSRRLIRWGKGKQAPPPSPQPHNYRPPPPHRPTQPKNPRPSPPPPPMHAPLPVTVGNSSQKKASKANIVQF